MSTDIKTPGSVYLVGGAVRDKRLGHPVSDRDWVVVGASPEQMIDAGFQAVGKDFPVFLHPITGEEYALARTERKTGSGYAGFSFQTGPDVTLEDDLARRDLTINAMAEDAEGNLIDPYGGAKDLADGRLRHVSAAFAEDPVRILRIARLNARYADLGFFIDEDTQELMASMVDRGEVDHLVPERVWKETVRALGGASPDVFIQVLRDCGALGRIMPEVDALFGVPQPPKHHPEIDTGVHTLMVLEQAARLTDCPITRYAALTHDLGKALTPKDLLPRHHGHEESGARLVEGLSDRLGVPTEFKRLAVIASRQHTNCHRVRELRPGKVLKLLKELDVFRKPETLDRFLMCCRADAQGRTGFEDAPYPQVDYLQTMFQTCQEVSNADIAAAGYKGAAFGEELDRRRIMAIHAMKAKLQQDQSREPDVSSHSP